MAAIGKAIHNRRLASGLTVGDLGPRLNLTLHTESRRESGYLSIACEDLATYAAAFGCKASDIVLDAEKLLNAPATAKRGRPTKSRKS